jgi:hypothetical protein
MMTGTLVISAAKLCRLFNFHLLFYMAEAPSSPSTLIAFFNFNHHRQLHPSLPSTSTLVTFNFNPRPQLHPSSPTLTLVAFHFPNPVAFLFPPLLLDGCGVLDAAAAR